jgi:hypothetical protein
MKEQEKNECEIYEKKEKPSSTPTQKHTNITQKESREEGKKKRKRRRGGLFFFFTIDLSNRL